MATEWTVATLKEHFERLLAEKEKSLRESLSEREQALKLQAAEYERRLDLLNHENDRIAKNAANKVSYTELLTICSVITAIIAAVIAYTRH